ncbi:unnamed protein product [Toxocara canis]|uniref:Calponin-homology (CH) domain-containing protein n=1 Tax=Toxocara canis TaxID=6265 RepID=A0A183U7A2_TOXCA|nr:unnamed protein product [Toxocara canis]
MVPDMAVHDFEDTWKDGFLLCALVQAAGGKLDGTVDVTPSTHAQRVSNIRKALKAASRLGVSSLVSADDIADPLSDHLGLFCSSIFRFI